MKIRRVRRGFTTNSSASSEWLPPTSTATSGRTAATTGTNPSTLANHIPSSIPLEQQAREQAARDANLLKIGGLIAFVAIAFVVERSVRFVRKKRHLKEDL